MQNIKNVRLRKPWKTINRQKWRSSHLNHNHDATTNVELMTTTSRPRLPRSVKQDAYYNSPAGWDPDVPSDDPHIEMIERLNQQGFPHNAFAEADDVLMKTLFMTKAKSHRWAAIVPELASSSRSSRRYIDSIHQDMLSNISKRCNALTHPEPQSDLTRTVQQSLSVFREFPIFQNRGSHWEAALQQ